jgi:hypothetical protein
MIMQAMSIACGILTQMGSMKQEMLHGLSACTLPTAQELIVSVGAGENRNNHNQASVHAPTSLPAIEEEDQVVVDESAEDDEVVQTLEPAVTTTSSGRATRAPAWMRDYTMAAIKMTDQETAYLNLTKGFEMGLMGAGVGGGFINTQELHVLKYNQAMKGPDKKHWQVAVEEEHERMIKNKVWKAVPKTSVPKEATILTSTWAMKKKASGVYHARLNARGYEQIDGEHFDKDTKDDHYDHSHGHGWLVWQPNRCTWRISQRSFWCW